VIRRGLAILIVLGVLSALLAACQGSGDGEDEEAIDPLALLQETADAVRAAQTFRIDVVHSGAKYYADILITETIEATVAFNRATGDYVAPDLLQATVQVALPDSRITQDIGILSNGPRQYVRFPPAPWFEADFAPGFNPEALIAEESGFQAALASLTDLQYVGQESLDTGEPVYHLSGIADGVAVTDLLVGVIEIEGTVPIDVYIHRETRYPARLVVRQPGTETEEEPEPTMWTIEVYDYNAAIEITPPEE